MKKVLLFIIFFLLGVLVVIGYTLFRRSPGKPIDNILQTVAKPQFSVENAPSETIKGNITQMTGKIMRESRAATESSEIKTPVILQQGEQIRTGEDGNLSVEFGKAASIKIEPKTQIDFVQTLPVSFVVSIASGSAQFKKLSNIPVSVRSYHLLIKQEIGEMAVSLDLDRGLTNIKLLSGSIVAAYNDINLTSHVDNFNAPQEISFNDSTRMFEEASK